MSRTPQQTRPCHSRRASGFWTRLAAAFAALAVLAVSVQAGFAEICSLCPIDCPMHATHGIAAPADTGTAAAVRCHGAKPNAVGVDLAFRRPPCRSSFTLSASLLPPFVLGAPTELRAFTFYSRLGPDVPERAIHRSAAPETPPPISFA